MDFLTVSEIEEKTGISASTVRAMLRDGVLEGYESGGRWVVPQHAVDTLEVQLEATEEALESGENEPDEEGDDEENEENEPDEEDLDEDEEEAA